MNIDYVSTTMNEKDFVELFKNSNKLPGQQAQKYNRLVIQGLVENGVLVRAVTSRPITNKNCSRKYISGSISKCDSIVYDYSTTFNIRGIRNVWNFFTTFYKVFFGKSDAVIIDVLNASIAYAASIAAKLSGRPCVGIVTDLPELMVTGTSKSYAKLVRQSISNCTSFVLLTEAMNSEVNFNNKPYVIIEGLCDSNILASNDYHNSSVRKCMYAGLLDARYGVKNMVEGFILSNIDNTELHIYGDGPYAEEISKITQKHKNVIYHGSVMNEEVVKAELMVDLLINPRPTNEDFTKFSFPSKNMEYMASGTPVLTTNLPGMPFDYKRYVYIIEDETVEGIAQALKGVMELPVEIVKIKGKNAQTYVLEQKNSKIQSSKILKLLK